MHKDRLRHGPPDITGCTEVRQVVVEKRTVSYVLVPYEAPLHVRNALNMLYARHLQLPDADTFYMVLMNEAWHIAELNSIFRGERGEAYRLGCSATQRVYEWELDLEFDWIFDGKWLIGILYEEVVERPC